MRCTRIIAGHYEITTEYGVFKVDHECDLWFVVDPDGHVEYGKTYAEARRLINENCGRRDVHARKDTAMTTTETTTVTREFSSAVDGYHSEGTRTAHHALMEVAEALADGKHITGVRTEGAHFRDPWEYTITIVDDDGDRTTLQFREA